LIRISRSAVPTKVTWPTPATCASLGWTVSFKKWLNSRVPMVEVAPIRSTGCSLRESFDSDGALAVSGRSAAISFSFRCASCIAKSRFASCWNSTVTMETPSCEVAWTVLTLSRADTASSTGLVTDVSTSPAEAPG